MNIFEEQMDVGVRTRAFLPAMLTAFLIVCAANRTWTADLSEVSDPGPGKTVPIHVFWSPECGHCEPVEREALDKLERELGLRIEPTYIDIDQTENYAKLVKVEKLMGVPSQDLPEVLVGSQIIGGVDALKQKLGPAISRVVRTGERWPGAVDEVLRSAGDLEVRAGTAGKVYGVYFTLAACQHCRRTDHVVKYLAASTKGLELRTYDKQDMETQILQEALEERLGIPVAERGVRPRLIVGTGLLTNVKITDVTAEELMRSAVVAGQPPWVLGEPERAAARKRLTQLFDSFTFGTMVVAGLVDGINPCAFAVIVFFISCLAALGRARAELLAIGASFVFAVFSAYFAIGLGMSELLGILSAVPWIGRVVSLAVAGLAFFLAAASSYDFVLVLRGKPREILLQLPRAVKQRINLTISRRVGGAQRDAADPVNPEAGEARRRFRLLPLALSALASGILVSFLELACTGQIYLPAIRMMLFDASGHRIRALGYLFIYNMAFIVPLIGVFFLAYAGVTSEQLRAWLNRHLGGTKLAMGSLFVALGVIILVIEL